MSARPTVVLGVGQAGIEVLFHLEEMVTESGDQEQFRYIAIDSDMGSLHRAPEAASTTMLEPDGAFLREDIERYPYLLDSMSIQGTGAKRQRPVGRYLIDRQGTGGFDDVFVGLTQEIGDHYENVEAELAPGTAPFNIVMVHSFGGGTGSGAYPLLLAMLDEIVEHSLEGAAGLVSLSGIGIVSELTFDWSYVEPPSGATDYYPNNYAALRNLQTLVGIHGSTETLDLPLWSKALVEEETTEGRLPKFELETVPFDDYWLVGVHEDRMRGAAAGRAGPESYIEEVDRTVARSIHALSRLETAPAAWPQNTPFTGTFTQAEVSVPHGQVESLVEQKEQRATREERIGEIAEKIDELRAENRRLESLKPRPGESARIDDELAAEVDQTLAAHGFDESETMVGEKDIDDVRAVLDKIQEGFQIRGRRAAIDRLQNRLSDEGGAPAVESEWRETVDRLWSAYDLRPATTAAGTGYEQRAATLGDHLTDRIEEVETVLEEWDPWLLERLQDAMPPVADPLESDREAAKRLRERLQADRADLRSVQADAERVTRMRNALKERRAELRQEIDSRIAEHHDEITALQNEQDELEREIKQIERSIEGLKRTLTEETVNERIAVLPLEEDRVDDIDGAVLESDLTSLAAYVDEGYVDEEKLRYALNDRLDFCQAWEEEVIARDFTETDREQRFQARDELWYLFHEDNERLLDYITEMPDAATVVSGRGKLQHLSDPYRIEYISFARRGPIAALEIFQSYEELKTKGWLQEFANQYEDYRQAFAYPEWYEEEIRSAFESRR